MGVLIPGMKMPPRGKVNLLVMFDDGRVQDNSDGQNQWQAIEIPPHGRLGDLDEMAVDESEAYMSAQLKLGDDVITKAINEAVHAKIVRLIADTPPIIPAEGGEQHG